MGWASGSGIAEEIWGRFKKYVPEDDIEEEAYWLYSLFNERDADGWSLDDELIIDSGMAAEWAEEWEE